MEQARREGRAFEDLFNNMYPDEEVDLEEDDCRPVDAAVLDALSDADRSVTTDRTGDYPTRTTESLQPIPRQRPRPNAIPGADNATASSISTDEDITWLRISQRRADANYERHLLKEVVQHWREQTQQEINTIEEEDNKYNAKIARKCLDAMRDEFDKADDIERKRRLKLFLVWKSRKLAIWAIRAWIVRHRENVVRKIADDGQNFRTASTALAKWRLAAAQVQQRKASFRQFFYACKFFRRWKKVVAERRLLRSFAVIEERFNQHQKQKETKLLRVKWDKWRSVVADESRDEIRAVRQHETYSAKQAKTLAHKAITAMYLSTATGLTLEAKADNSYKASLVKRVLSEESEWRIRVRRTEEQEEKADQIDSIRDERRAVHAVRVMRRTAARSRQMDDDAEVFHARMGNNSTRRLLKRWRAEVAERRGETPVQEPPATPAAKLTALRLSQSRRG